jgi:hypothetical protein
MNVTFLSAKQTHEFIARDEDRFISSMTKADLCARAVRSKQTYLTQACQAADDFTEEEKLILFRNVQIANKFLYNLRSVPGLNPALICKIPWVFAKCSYEYESGLPHTRQNIIFTMNGQLKVRDCIHEKIHVYQRMYPDAAKMFLIARGFIRVQPHPLRRANPDQDNNTYIKDGRVYDGVYTSENPVNISDVQQFRHPYEVMSYEAIKVLGFS